MFSLFKYMLAFIFLCLMSFEVQAAAPRLLFSDLISGPDTGIGDGQGSGVIVTVWGQNLGERQKNNSKVFFTDSSGVKREAAHIYYWKNADGELPGGPAKLFESHKAHEIAFSIPDSAAGAGTISVSVDGLESNTLPFSVRAGNIYHVKANGSDSAAGSFNSPWKTVEKADGTATAGDTLYIHNVETGSPTTSRGIYNNRGFKADTSNQMAYVAYPDTRPVVRGYEGFHVYKSTGIVVSKLFVRASNCDASGNNCAQKDSWGIDASDWGRVTGNAITDIEGRCANAWQGAINGKIDKNQGAKFYGNYIFDYSCPEATKFHHTTYIKIRAKDDPDIVAWEFGWNYLKDNKAKNGIHNYDEGTGCGDIVTDLLIHDNVIVNQAGAGIAVISNCGWSQDSYIYNNVLINVGLASDIHCTINCGPNGSGITIGSGTGTAYIFNNTIYKWDQENLGSQGSSCIAVANSPDDISINMKNNICYNDVQKKFIDNFFNAEAKLDNFTGSNNIWYYPGATSAATPSWDTNSSTTDPMIKSLASPVLYLTSKLSNPSVGTPKVIAYDIYGNSRPGNFSIGAFEYYISPPKSPGNVAAIKSVN